MQRPSWSTTVRQLLGQGISPRVGLLMAVATVGGMVLGFASILAEAYPHVLRNLGLIIGMCQTQRKETELCRARNMC